MKRSINWDISAGAILVFSVFYFLDDSGLLAAALPAIAVHELAHAASLRLFGAEITRIKITLAGLEMDYSGKLSRGRLLCAALAGPFAGLAYAGAALSVSSGYLRVSGAASLLLSVFNLLPVLPLDGGRASCCIFGAERGAKVSRVCCVGVLLLGLALAVKYGNMSLLIMGVMLIAYNLF